MYRTILLVVLVTHFVTADAILCDMKELHTTQDKPTVWLISELHNYISNPRWLQWYDTGREQHEFIRKCIREYAGTAKLHIFHEGCSYKQFRCYVHHQVVKLPALNTKRVIIEDFDIRRLLVVAIEAMQEESPDLRFHYMSFYADGDRGDERIDTDQVTFGEVWNEIETYGTAISYACKAHLGELYESSLACRYLIEAQILYHDLLRCCAKHDIAPDDKVRATGNSLFREPRLYRKRKEGIVKDLREHMYKTSFAHRRAFN